MAKTKCTILTTRANGDNDYIYISFETSNITQMVLAKKCIEDFANDFEERFINFPLRNVEIPADTD